MPMQAMTVAKLTERAAGADPFRLSYEDLGIEGAQGLFEQYLQGDLVVSSHTFQSMTLQGRTTVPGVCKDATATVRFSADASGSTVTGVSVTVQLAGWEVSTSYLKLSLSELQNEGFKQPALVLAAEPGTGGAVTSTATAAVGFTMPGQAGATGLLKVTGSDGVYTVGGEFPPKELSLAKLADLAGLPLMRGVSAQDLAFPEELEQLLKQMSLTGVGAVYQPGSGVQQLWLEVDLPSSWQLVPDVVELDGIRARFSVGFSQAGAARRGRVSAELRADCKVFGLPLQARISVPDLLLTAYSLQPKGAEELAKKHTAGIGISPTRVSYLYVYCDVRQLDYRLAVGLDVNWQVSETISVSKLFLQLSGPGKVPRVSVVGALDFGGVELTVAASDTGSGWLLSAEADDISLDNVRKWLGQHNVTLPDAVGALTVSRFSLMCELATKKVTLYCAGQLPIGDASLDCDLQAEITPGSEAKVTGGLTLALPPHGGADEWRWMRFEAAFDRTKGSGTFVAGYSAADAVTAVSLRSLVAGLSTDVAKEVPADLAVGLKDAKLVYVKPAGAPKGVLCLGVDLSATIDLSELPLIGDHLPADETLAVKDLQILYNSGELDAASVATVNQLLDKGVSQLPASGLKQGVAVLAELQLGQSKETVALGIAAQASGGGGGGGGGGESAVDATALTEVSDVPQPQASTPSAHWFTVQKQFGVIQINRVGVLYQKNALVFALDAGITLGPLRFSLDGLSVGSGLEKFEPVFNLSGLGLAYSSPPLEISGALLRLPDDPVARKDVRFQFDGYALVATSQLTLAAVGSYAQLVGGAPSLFVFAQLDYPLGGPPFLFVTGLMAGFGFNRTLGLPTRDEVTGFPLLVLNKSGAAADATGVLDVLEGRKPAVPGGKARQWIAPRPGSYWLALGLEFTSFKVVDTKAVLVAEFGPELVLALIGTSVLRLPLAEESATASYVYAELGLEALCKPSEGSAELTAQLSAASYVITEACHLTGGFAFSVWFDPSHHNGQFVVTLGGYHPAFTPPPYYPRVPRLGINWAVSETASISGDAYLAVTPTCAMAGGGLSAVFHSGSLRAWFTAQADLLVSWRPFFFTASISVSIGVSYRLNLLVCHKTVSVSVGADVSLWGPPTGGTVHVDLTVVSFSVDFGAGHHGTADGVLDWAGLRAMLPKPDRIITLQPVSGLFKTEAGAASSSGKKWIVRARDFRFVTQSAVPASHLCYGDGDPTPAGSPVAIRPMGLSGVTATHRITVKHDKQSTSPADWTCVGRTQELPESLWGEPPSPFTQIPAAPGAKTVERTVGYSVAAKPPTLAASRGVFPLSVYAKEQVVSGASPLYRDPKRSPDYHPAPDPDPLKLIAGLEAASGARGALYDALVAARVFGGVNGSLAELAKGAGHLFSDPPMIQK